MNILVFNESYKRQKSNIYQSARTFLIKRAEPGNGKLKEMGGKSNG